MDDEIIPYQLLTFQCIYLPFEKQINAWWNLHLHIFQSKYFIHLLYGKISSCIYLPFEKQINAWWNLHLHTFQSKYFIHVLYGKISSCIYLPFEKQINAWWNLHLHTFQSIYFMSCMGRFQSQYFIHVLYGKTFQSQYFMSCMGRFHQHDEILPQWVLTNISNHNHTPSYYYYQSQLNLSEQWIKKSVMNIIVCLLWQCSTSIELLRKLVKLGLLICYFCFIILISEVFQFLIFQMETLISLFFNNFTSLYYASFIKFY
jgi:hypothetical protein